MVISELLYLMQKPHLRRKEFIIAIIIAWDVTKDCDCEEFILV